MRIKYKFLISDCCYFVTFVEKAEDWIYPSTGTKSSGCGRERGRLVPGKFRYLANR